MNVIRDEREEQLSGLPAKTALSEAILPSPLKAASEAAALLSLGRHGSSEHFQVKAALEQTLRQLFPADRRLERICAAAGGRDIEGQTVRYLRSVGWKELEILLREGKIEFPLLHPEIDQKLSVEHQYRLKHMLESDPLALDHIAQSLSPLLKEIQTLTYRQATYLCAAVLPFDTILLEHACGRGGGQVFSPFLSTTTGGPMMSPVSNGVSIEVIVPFPRAFTNWQNGSIEQESLITELRLEDINCIYFDEDRLMDDLLAPDSQLFKILPDAIADYHQHDPQFNRFHPVALTCWRCCEHASLLPDLWRDEIQAERARDKLRHAYREWGLKGLANGKTESISEFFLQNSALDD